MIVCGFREARGGSLKKKMLRASRECYRDRYRHLIVIGNGFLIGIGIGIGISSVSVSISVSVSQRYRYRYLYLIGIGIGIGIGI